MTHALGNLRFLSGMPRTKKPHEEGGLCSQMRFMGPMGLKATNSSDTISSKSSIIVLEFMAPEHHGAFGCLI
jgi:hypothetical protein